MKKNTCTKDGYTDRIYWYCTEKGIYYSRKTGWRCEEHARSIGLHLIGRSISLLAYHVDNNTFHWSNIIGLLKGAIQSWQKEKALRRKQSESR